MGKMQRTKGHSYERECAKLLRGIFPDAKRHLEVQIQDCQGYDLDNTGKFRFQCKRMKKWASISKIKEVTDLDGTIPALITKGDREKSVVALYLDDFIKILKGESFE